jgi:hypothetical protein
MSQAVTAEISRSEPVQSDALSVVRTSVSTQEVCSKLDAAASRGRLPGLVLNGRQSALFSITDFGHPFEGVLIARRDSLNDLRFETRLKPIGPALFAIVLVLAVWPGLLLTDSMLRVYFSWYDIPTWWWYLPLTVPSSPWAWRSAIRKSRESVHQRAQELIGKVAAEVGGTVLPGGEAQSR